MDNNKLVKLDRSFLNKLDSIISRLGREVNPLYYGRCERSVFINRLFLKLNGKTFKIYHDNKISYISLIGATTRSSDYPEGGIKTAAIKYSLGYKTLELDVCFINEKVEHKNIILSYNNLLDIRISEIEKEEYINIVNLFIFKEPLKKFKFKKFDLDLKDLQSPEIETEFSYTWEEIENKHRTSGSITLIRIGEEIDATDEEIETFNSIQNG